MRVLLTNDDGPPGKYSPYIYGLWKHLTYDLGWDVKVVIPSSQKSWIGAAFQIKDTINGRYYYPQEPSGDGETSESSRSLNQGELAEWILLDGTPATCANIALHNLYRGEIDLVVSGPNLGRNTSTAFSLSSGTLGAALSSALSTTRAIALSYGTMKNPVTDDLHLPAHQLSAKVITHLVNTWGNDPEGLRSSKEIDMYSVNVPMIPELLDPTHQLPIRTTTFWRQGYGRLFEAHREEESDKLESENHKVAGPAARQGSDTASTGKDDINPENVGNLIFKWAPEMKKILNPSDAPENSDARALQDGYVSITPIRATFAQPDAHVTFGEFVTKES